MRHSMARFKTDSLTWIPIMTFDHDSNGIVDLEEFKAETKRMMLDMANDFGFLPVQMILDEDSFLKKAVERELTKLQSDTSAA
ncbi:hypothetical protein L1887_25055 [Cichorium endivia]|nr:hypothetical protein L1887_25055 [Cichorium endivia]